MSETSVPCGSQQYLHVFRRYVLDILTTAESRLTRERDEIGAEIEAFDQFADIVADVEPSGTGTGPLSARNTFLEQSASATEEIRTAYLDTVMSVPHIEDDLDESLEENLAAELCPELAAVVRSSTVRLSAAHRETIVAMTEQAVENRESFREALDSERESLRTERTAIVDVLDSLDDVLIQPWYRQEFESKLDEIVHRRQCTLQRRRPLNRHDRHDLCEYLYQEEPWTYPVLTAVTRLRDSVVLGERRW